MNVSVVIPCFNQAHYLGEAIASAEPGRRGLEVIVIDDGSTDDTAAVAARSGVRCLHQRNRGLAAARNAGLAEARGEFIVFLDADDRLLPEAIDIGLDAFASHPDCALVFGRAVMTGADGALWPTPDQPRVERDHHHALLRRNLIWSPAMAMFRRSAVVAAGGFTSGFDAAADYDLYLRISREHPVFDHGLIVAWYRRHGENMSGSAARMLRETLAVMRRHRDAAMRDPGTCAAWREGWRTWQEFYGTQLVEEIRDHVHTSEWVPALRKALTLARHNPRRVPHELGRWWAATDERRLRRATDAHR
jgi:glycosyltransferase involved in cell wall biosynthesis